MGSGRGLGKANGVGRNSQTRKKGKGRTLKRDLLTGGREREKGPRLFPYVSKQKRERKKVGARGGKKGLEARPNRAGGLCFYKSNMKGRAISLLEGENLETTRSRRDQRNASNKTWSERPIFICDPHKQQLLGEKDRIIRQIRRKKVRFSLG